MASSPTQIQYLIDNAQVNTTGLVPWTGTRGEQAILTAINERLRDTGVMVVPTVEQLEILGSNNARIVLLVGAGIYGWNPSSINPPSTSIINSGGGRWDLLLPYDGFVPLATREEFPDTGSESVLYLAIDTGILYYWDDDDYFPVNPTIWSPSESKLTLANATEAAADFILTGDAAGFWTVTGPDLFILDPTTAVDVRTELRIDANNAASLKISNGAPIKTNEYIAFEVDSSEVMRIASDGSILIGTTTANAKSIFTVASTTKGTFPVPRMTTSQINAIAATLAVGDAGMEFYDTTINKKKFWNGSAIETITSA